MNNEGKAPGQSHAAFAREVVALARKHGMDHLSLSFSHSFSRRFLEPPYSEDGYSGRVNCTWTEGRHGAESRIRIAFEGAMSVDELPR